MILLTGTELQVGVRWPLPAGLLVRAGACWGLINYRETQLFFNCFKIFYSCVEQKCQERDNKNILGFICVSSSAVAGRVLGPGTLGSCVQMSGWWCGDDGRWCEGYQGPGTRNQEEKPGRRVAEQHSVLASRVLGRWRGLTFTFSVILCLNFWLYFGIFSSRWNIFFMQEGLLCYSCLCNVFTL